MGIRRSERGLSIVEVLLAAAICSVIALGLAEMMRNSAKGTRSLALSNDLESIASVLGQILNKEASCRDAMQASLGAMLPADVPKSIPSITTSSAGTIAQVEPAGPGLRVRALQFDKLIVPNLGPRSDGRLAYVVNLRMDAEKRGMVDSSGQAETLPGAPSITKNFAVTLVVNPATGAIFSCYGAVGVADICNSLGGIPNTAGDVCDIAKPICEKLGGVYDPAAVPPAAKCTFAGPGPVDLTQRICLDLGGTFNPSGVPKCTFPTASTNPESPTSLKVVCTASGGALVGSGATVKCDTCTKDGGTFDPSTGKCNMHAPVCADVGGTWNAGAGKCVLPAPMIDYGSCTGVSTSCDLTCPANTVPTVITTGVPCGSPGAAAFPTWATCCALKSG